MGVTSTPERILYAAVLISPKDTSTGAVAGAGVGGVPSATLEASVRTTIEAIITQKGELQGFKIFKW